jgi:hypothetical protein
MASIDDFENGETVGDALASAIAEHEEAASVGENATPPPAPDGSESNESDTGEPQPKRRTEQRSGAEQAEAERLAAAEKPDAPEKSRAASASESAKDREIIKRLPREAQDFLTRKTQEIASFKRDYEPVDKIFEPYREKMKAGGWTPHKLVEAWSNVERRLMEGDAVNVIAGLVKGYQVNLGDIAKTLGLRPRQPQANGQADPNGQSPQPQPEGMLEHQLPPQVARQLQAWQDRFDAEDRMRANEARRHQTASETRVMNEIDQFKSAKDGKGDLLHPHFEELEEAMTLLAQSANANRKPVPPLKELYETAVWAHPSTREATLAAREKAKAVQARRAGSSVTGSPNSGRSIREELEAAMGGR